MRAALFVPLLVGVLAVLWLQLRPLHNIPEHLLGHPSVHVPELLSVEDGRDLRALMRRLRVFPTNAADLRFYKTQHEHIGEAVPLTDAARGCDHPFLVPNTDRTLCVLPGRVDVGRFYVMTGGVMGKKENYSSLISRVQSFGVYNFLENNANVWASREYAAAAGSDDPGGGGTGERDAAAELAGLKKRVIDSIFGSDRFQRAAVDVCPADKQVLSPFQYNFIVQLPGQTVATHLDAPYFWGASRMQFPQWLLVVMVFSGLFRDEFIDQVQVVGYPHQWSDPARRGDFVFWDGSNEGRLRRVPPTPLSGVSVDGSKTVHAAVLYEGAEGAPQLPLLDKSRDHELRFEGGDRWDLVTDGRPVRSYAEDDLRLSIVFRARCFASDADRLRYNERVAAAARGDSEAGALMRLDDVFARLLADLVARGRLDAAAGQLSVFSGPEGRLRLAMLLMDEFIAYPYPSPSEAILPFNFCALSRLYPALAGALGWIC